MFNSIVGTLYARQSYDNRSTSSLADHSIIDAEVESLRNALSDIYRKEISEDGMSICTVDSQTEYEEALYRTKYGRELNNSSDVYVFPADPEEKTRLYRQNLLIRAAVGAYPLSVREILERDPHDKAVLDLGCGDGTWIFEVASHFPLCRAVGVDLVPVEADQPDNFMEEIWDINRGLVEFYDQYDVVHARLLSHGISDFPKLIDGMAKSLRRNGVLLLCEFDFKIYKSDRTLCYPWGSRQTPDEPTSYLAIWFAVLRNAIKTRGGTVDAPDRMVELLRSHPYFNPESIYIVERWFPFAPYTYTRDFQNIGYTPDRLSGMGDLVRSDVLSFLKSGRVVLLMNGMSEEEAIKLEHYARMELFELRHPCLARLLEVHIRRRP